MNIIKRDELNDADKLLYDAGARAASQQAARIVRSTEGTRMFLGDIADLITADAKSKEQEVAEQGELFAAGYAYGTKESFETVEYGPATATVEQMAAAVERGDWSNWDFEAEERAEHERLGF